jgi:hypothetical protein
MTTSEWQSGQDELLRKSVAVSILKEMSEDPRFTYIIDFKGVLAARQDKLGEAEPEGPTEVPRRFAPPEVFDFLWSILNSGKPTTDADLLIAVPNRFGDLSASSPELSTGRFDDKLDSTSNGILGGESYSSPNAESGDAAIEPKPGEREDILTYQRNVRPMFERQKFAQGTSEPQDESGDLTLREKGFLKTILKKTEANESYMDQLFQWFEFVLENPLWSYYSD